MSMYKISEFDKDFSITVDASTELAAVEWYAQQFKIERDCTVLVEPRGYKSKKINVKVHRTYSVSAA
jgi:hypothetical protein